MLVSYIFYETRFLVVKTYSIKIPDLPPAFKGFTILHLSDLHSKYFGEKQKDLLALIREQQYDLVAFTGDMVNKKNPLPEPGLELVKGLAGKPVYFVPGNHEWSSGYQIRQPLLDSGVEILENRSVKISRKKEHIWLAGVDDPYLGRDDLDQALSDAGEDQAPRLLLAHAPEIFDGAAKAGIDLVMVGHTHGGQVRLPVLGALIVPGQGFFPKYDYGVYSKEQTRMVITGGLGESGIPVRFNMDPEIVLIKLV